MTLTSMPLPGTAAERPIDHRLHQIGQVKAMMGALDRLTSHHGFSPSAHADLQEALIAEAGLLARGGPAWHVHDAAPALSAMPAPTLQQMDALRDMRMTLARQIEKTALIHLLGGQCWATALVAASSLITDPRARSMVTEALEALAPRTTHFTGWQAARPIPAASRSNEVTRGFGA